MSSEKNNVRNNRKENLRGGDKYSDWKDIANSYYDKSLSLAVLFVLFTFLVTPSIEVQPYEAEITVTEAIDIPPDVREPIEPPEELVRPVVDIVIDAELEGEDEDLEIISTISETTLDPRETIERPTREGRTPRFVHYEEPPQAIRQVPPVYPRLARQRGLEGTVMLLVEVLRDGSVGAIEVQQSLQPGPGGVDEAAINAVRQWEFTPAKSGGQPVAVWASVPVQFRLD